MAKTTLCVLFNHPYLKNIPILEEIYAGKFDRIYFVVPNTLDPRPNVITSYRGSYIFHGFVVDAAPKLLADDSTHFFFVQDDVLLNPRFSGAEWVEKLRVEPGGAFIPHVRALDPDVADWSWTLGFLWKTQYPMNEVSGSGVEEWYSLLPDPFEATLEVETKYGLDFTPIQNKKPTRSYGTVRGPQRHPLNQAIVDGLYWRAADKDGIRLPYPYCRGMSDFFVVNRATLEKLVHTLGIFAAMQVFVEIAIPTALLLTADKVSFNKDTGTEVNWLWNEDRSQLNAESIIKGFEENLILVHPLKLSKDAAIVRSVLDHFAAPGVVPAVGSIEGAPAK